MEIIFSCLHTRGFDVIVRKDKTIRHGSASGVQRSNEAHFLRSGQILPVAFVARLRALALKRNAWRISGANKSLSRFRYTLGDRVDLSKRDKAIRR